MSLKNMLACGLVFSAFCAFSSAWATTENNKTINTLGSQFGSVYVTFNEPSSGCSNNIFYANDLTQASTRGYYAALLTAKSIGKGISRIDYTVDSSGQCQIQLIEIAK